MIPNILPGRINFFVVLIFGLLCGFIINEGVNAQVQLKDFSSSINIEKLKHPYLFFSDKDKPEMIERINNDSLEKKIMQELLAEGNRYVKMPFKEKVLFEPEHPRFDTDHQAVSYAGEVTQGALTLAFLYQITGDTVYVKRAIEFAIAICNIPVWVNGAHEFDIIYPRVWPWNVPDDRVVFSYDITAAGKARNLAVVYDWLYPVLNKHDRDKIRNALLEKAITRVRGNYEFFWWATAYRCNWSAICYSSLGVTALSLLKENPQLIDVANEAYNRMTLTFNQIGEDGGWQEGRGYYGYMMRESIQFMDALKRVSNGKYNLFMHSKLKDHPLDFLLYGLTANFEDSEGGPVGPSSVVNKLTQETGNSTAAWYAKNYIDNDSDIFDLIWPSTSVQPVKPNEKSKIFRTINWAVLREDFNDPTAFTIACKAGFNDDPHHGHLDCGQFILTWHNKPFIRDLGRMRYDEFYFNQDRWDYPFASSEGHNLIYVNGEQQIPAKLKDKPWKKGIGGNILDFRTSEKEDYVLMDPTNAYPGKELKKWRRNIVFEKPDIMLILDEVEAKTGSKIEARFFPGVAEQRFTMGRRSLTPAESGVDYKVHKDYVYMTDKKNNLAVIPCIMNNNFSIVDDYLEYIPVTSDGRLTKIPYFETVVKTNSETSLIATLILPVRDQKDAETIISKTRIESGDNNEVIVSMETPAGSYKWYFEKKDEGYILK